jgi:hypothetical protein
MVPLINMLHKAEQQSDLSGLEGAQNRNWKGAALVKQHRDQSGAAEVATMLSINKR